MSKSVPAVLLLLLLSAVGYSAVEAAQVQASPPAPGSQYLGGNVLPYVANVGLWTPDDTINPDDSDSASITIWVKDGNGWQDITSVTVDLAPLGYASDTPCTIVQDTTDVYGLGVIATLTGVKAKPGTRCTEGYEQPPHDLYITCRDHEGSMTYSSPLQLRVTGDTWFDAFISHRRVSNWYLEDAQIVAVGGGIPGATDPRASGPFTYISAPSDMSGYVGAIDIYGGPSLQMSAGTFAITARKLGFGSDPLVYIDVPYEGSTMNIYIRPLSIKEAAALPNGTKANIEAVCVAQPQGFDPTAAYGLASRIDTEVERNQWYMCDPNDPTNGMLCMVTKPNESFPFEWDDTGLYDPSGNPLYFGKRPAFGETVMITGILDTPSGAERRVLIDDSDMWDAMSSYPYTEKLYLNRGYLGGMPSPSIATIPQLQTMSHGNYVQVNDLVVTSVVTPGDGCPPYIIAQDSSANTIKITVETPDSLHVLQMPFVGNTYSFRGVLGLGCDGTDTLRVRRRWDIISPANPSSVAACKGQPDNSEVYVEGVCTAWPEGAAPTAAYGLAHRADGEQMCDQLYISDPNNPDSGILCLIEAGMYQWNSPAATATYFGARPVIGQTVRIRGTLDTPAGLERRIKVTQADLQSCYGDFYFAYENKGNLGGLPSPMVSTVPGLQALDDGSLVTLNGLVITTPSISSPGCLPYMYACGNGSPVTITLDTDTSLHVTPPAVGSTCNITGILSRGCGGQATIRPRQAADIQLVAPPPTPNPLRTIRNKTTGDSVDVSGIVTMIGPDYLYIESSDRGAGVRVQAVPPYIKVGDLAEVIGTLGMHNGEKTIAQAQCVIDIGDGSVPSPFDLRSRDVGGDDFGPNDPGVTDGRGALNIGLLAHVSGMVTAVDPAGHWFYIWDGANRSDAPAGDGAGNIGVRIAGDAGYVPWVDWVEVTGVVSADSTIVSGRTIPVVLPTSIAKVTEFDQVTAVSGAAVKAQWNLIGLPVAPAATGDGDEWTPKPWDPYIVLSPDQSPDDIDTRLQRWENCTGGLNIWDQWSEVGSHGTFGGLVLGDGYWLDSPADWAISYSGKASNLDQWISICDAGWIIMGQPKDHKTFMGDILVHDSTEVVSLTYDVILRGWFDCIAWWWDADTQGLVDIGIPDCWASTDTLQPWHGYWMKPNRGGLAIVIPETPAAP